MGRLGGIEIRVHWTFLLLIAWILLVHWQQKLELGSTIAALSLILAVFGCIVLHELGHALTGKRFGVRTRDITLLPIGGVARLERFPDDPRQELWIALAGPLVTVAIAAVLFLATRVTGWLFPSTAAAVVTFFTNLMWINVALAVFNLLPAFPMDGGRVYRAILARRMDYRQATQQAAGMGQTLAIILGILGFLTFNVILVFVAVFVYLGAQAEAQGAEVRSAIRGVPVRSAMMTRFRTLRSDEPLETAIDELLSGSQQDFPVVDADGRLVGLLPRSALGPALSKSGRQAPISDAMLRECRTVEETDLLEDVFLQMQEAPCPSIPVLHEGTLVGLVTLENIGEWILVQSALHGAPVNTPKKSPPTGKGQSPKQLVSA
jgi:Zn-dependent protease/predicted transcriptional regulator